MKKIVVMLVVLLLTAGAVGQLFAQDLIDLAVLNKLQLSASVKEQIKAMNMAQLQLEREIAADQKVLQARLQRILLDSDPDMNQVEAMLRQSLELRVKEELARITRTREMRKLMGEEEWMLFLRTRAEVRTRLENRINDGNPDRNSGSERSEQSSRNDGAGSSSAGTGSGSSNKR